MEPIRWGIIGAGKHFVQRVALPVVESKELTLHAVASRDSDKARRIADMFGIIKAYGSYDDLLADDSVDAVFIALPNDQHFDWIKRAADAGKHILCEKPLCLNASEAQKALDYTAKAGVLFMEAFMYRFQPRFKQVREWVRTGSIGALRAVNTVFSYANTDSKNIRNQVETGGGALYDIGCYAVSVSRWMFGCEPKRVMSLVRRDASFGTDILMSGLLDFGDGHGVFTASTQMNPCQSVELHGASGRMVIPMPFNPFDGMPSSVVVSTRDGIREVKFPPSDHYRLQFEAFSRAVQSGTTAPTPPQDAVANLAVMDALFKSEKSGGWEQPES